eukprot:gene5410-53321_t
MTARMEAAEQRARDLEAPALWKASMRNLQLRQSNDGMQDQLRQSNDGMQDQLRQSNDGMQDQLRQSNDGMQDQLDELRQ